MATVRVAEYSRVAEDNDGRAMQVADLSSKTAEYTIDGTGSGNSGPILQQSTKIVRLKSLGGSGVIAYGTAPTAVATGAEHLSDGVVEYFGVPGGSNPGRFHFINAT